MEQLLHVADHLVEVQHREADELAAAEGQELVGQVGGPLRGAPDLLHVAKDRLPALAAARRGRHELLGDEAGVVEDHGEQVVEVVRHPAGELVAEQPLGLRVDQADRTVRGHADDGVRRGLQQPVRVHVFLHDAQPPETSAY